MDWISAEIQATRSAIKAFERRMTRRLYVFAVGVVLATALLQHFWT